MSCGGLVGRIGRVWSCVSRDSLKPLLKSSSNWRIVLKITRIVLGCECQGNSNSVEEALLPGASWAAGRGPRCSCGMPWRCLRGCLWATRYCWLRFVHVQLLKWELVELVELAPIPKNHHRREVRVRVMPRSTLFTVYDASPSHPMPDLMLLDPFPNRVPYFTYFLRIVYSSHTQLPEAR